MSQRDFIRHVVFFTARDEADIPRIIEGLKQLGDIPHVTHFEVRECARMDQIANDVDVVVYAEFADRAAFDAYKAHPIYQSSIDAVRPLRDTRVAADF
ncbi:Stress responsive A/B Barrel Domain [Roseivivax halotolerans]|uniref:Stress responsive A/B Barrel Domain n=1 Tax=Roseivivax halotolerans TaxID=93684 RepID=A0A1I5US88_9RHOB|nr:Dabb family protein [Roseivivax halotolerans]SFP98133.1 Stress responsive A/B Barrel Domain [Roseivivax halotolerans]